MKEQSGENEKDFRSLREYRRFAARLMRVRDERTAVELASQTYHVNTEAQNLQLINAFYFQHPQTGRERTLTLTISPYEKHICNILMSQVEMH